MYSNCKMLNPRTRPFFTAPFAGSGSFEDRRAFFLVEWAPVKLETHHDNRAQLSATLQRQRVGSAPSAFLQKCVSIVKDIDPCHLFAPAASFVALRFIASIEYLDR